MLNLASLLAQIRDALSMVKTFILKCPTYMAFHLTPKGFLEGEAILILVIKSSNKHDSPH